MYTKDGSKRLSKPGTLEEAEKREKQVRFFKYKDKIKKSQESTKMEKDNSIFDNSGVDQYEDMMTAFDAMAHAQPADRAAFLKSIHNTPLEDKFKAVVKIWEDSGKSPELSKAFRDEFEKLGKTDTK